MGELEKFRKQIDAIDEEILNLLNKRAEVVIEIAHVKRTSNAKFYSPEREKAILERLTKGNKGPFPNDTLKVIYREILSASLSLEEPLRVAFFGPLATFTHIAASRHFGSSAVFLPGETIKSVFDSVLSGEAEFGVVPVENSHEGIVTHTLDLFMDYELKVAAEIMLDITHNLVSKSGKRKKIKKVYSNPHAAAQCRRWLGAHLPGITILDVTSTAKAAELSAKEEDAAGIASELAVKVYDLKFIDRNIGDSKYNVTRFLVISRESPPKTAKDKTSIMFTIKDKPGALYDILYPFKKAKINLTKIESRPSKRRVWEYIFFVDMEGHIEDKKLRKAIDTLKENCLYLKILGSYPCGDH
jgi:chorismate mutase/prephenate dehydratase